MNGHDAIIRMAKAWKHIQSASQLVTCPTALDHLSQAEKHIYDVGEGKFGVEFIESVKKQYQDS